MKKNGFSLVEIMVALGLAAGVGVLVMQISKNSMTVQGDATSSADYSEMRREIEFILDHADSCKASFAGKEFKASSINGSPLSGLEIWTADQTGARSRKKFFPGSDSAKIKITDITFSMPDYTGADFPEGMNQSFPGELVILGEKVNMGNKKKFRDITIPLTMHFATNGLGKSTVTGCSTKGSGSLSNVVISTYTDSCNFCERDVALGAHKFCTLSGVAGPGSIDTVCNVVQEGLNWKLHLKDGGDTGHTHQCYVVCLD